MNSETTPSLRAGQLNPSPPVYWFQITARFDSSSSSCYKATGCAIYKYHCVKFLRISRLWNVGMTSLWKNFILWKVYVFGCKFKLQFIALYLLRHFWCSWHSITKLQAWQQEFESWRRRRIFFSPSRPDRIWGPPSVLSSGYCALFSRR
jgi:hypothetical protein